MKRLLRHYKDAHHNDERPKDNYTRLNGVYRCKLCGVSGSSKSEIEKHLALSHAEAFVCPLCQRTFSSAYKYAFHMKTHNPKGDFSCPLCDMKTSKAQALFNHIHSMHLKNFLYYCSDCEKGFKDAHDFKEHEDFHKSGKIFACVVCGAKFPFSRYLLSHQRRAHHARIDGVVFKNQCTMCKLKFAKEASLQNHMQTRHWGLKPHLCDLCGKGFATGSKLKLHYRIHTGDKPFDCGYCEKSFSRKDYLVLHVRTHTGEKPCACAYCDKAFSQKTTLKIHMRSHTGEKPYACLICEAAFPVRAALTAHCKTCVGK